MKTIWSVIVTLIALSHSSVDAQPLIVASVVENSELLSRHHVLYVNTVYLSYLHRCLFKSRF